MPSFSVKRGWGRAVADHRLDNQLPAFPAKGSQVAADVNEILESHIRFELISLFSNASNQPLWLCPNVGQAHTLTCNTVTLLEFSQGGLCVCVCHVQTRSHWPFIGVNPEHISTWQVVTGVPTSQCKRTCLGAF